MVPVPKMVPDIFFDRNAAPFLSKNMSGTISQDMTALTLQIKVKPRSRVSSLEQVDDGSWVAKLKSPPVDGKANAELIALVARHFGCPRSAVRIRAGASGRLKLVQVERA